MKNFLKPTKKKILLAMLFSFLIMILFFGTQIIGAFLGLTLTDLGLPCMRPQSPQPFMNPGSTYWSEFITSGTHKRCVQPSQLQEIFLQVKLFTTLITFLIIIPYLLACTTVAIRGRKETKRKK